MVQVGRARPSFVDRCEPDVAAMLSPTAAAGNAQSHTLWTGAMTAQCTNKDADSVANAFRSFPSGHSSLSACGFLFLTLILFTGLQKSRWRGSFAAATAAAVPFCVGIWIGLTRISDCASLQALSACFERMTSLHFVATVLQSPQDSM